MKGIILAGGNGKRLYPISSITSKHLLPVYDKPMIYYPLSTLINSGVNDVLIIVSPEYYRNYESLLCDGSQLGINIEYRIQTQPLGIGHALSLAEDFASQQEVFVILGDNIFIGDYPSPIPPKTGFLTGCTIFGYPVKNPSDYGVVQLDTQNRISSIIEKPKDPKSNIAITGLYLFDSQVFAFAQEIQQSDRGEYEICDILNKYLVQNEISLHHINSKTIWLDAGTPDRIFEAASIVQEQQRKKANMIGCIEEAAWKQGFISDQQLFMLAKNAPSTDYRKYLFALLEGDNP